MQYANRAFYATFRVDAVETEQRRLVELGNQQWNVPGLVDRLLAIGLGHETLEDFVVEHDFPSLGRRVMLLDARRLRTAPGRPPLILLAIDDATERRRQDATLRQRQRLEALGRLAAGVSHDFNNLLTIIGARVEILLHRLGPSTPHARDLAIVRDTTQRAYALAGQLLVFGGLPSVAPGVVDPVAVVRGLEAQLRSMLPENVTLVIVLHSTGRIRADPGLLEQALVNLVANARDAMEAGGRLVIETLDMELDEAFARRHPGASAGPAVLLAVTDTGAGMNVATRDRAFEPFFTTRTSRKGAGLGLAVVYGIVAQSNGAVWIDSEPGSGTTVTACFPRVAEDAGNDRGRLAKM